MFHVMGVVLFPSTTSSYPVLIMQDHRKHLKINSFSTWEMSWVIELWCHSSRTVSWFRGRRGMLLDVGKFTKFHFHVSISTGTIIWGHLKPVYRVELVKFTKYEFSFNTALFYTLKLTRSHHFTDPPIFWWKVFYRVPWTNSLRVENRKSRRKSSPPLPEHFGTVYDIVIKVTEFYYRFAALQPEQ